MQKFSDEYTYFTMRYFSFLGYNVLPKLDTTRTNEDLPDNSDEEIEIEIIEVEEPEEPVPMQDSCLQVITILS